MYLENSTKACSLLYVSAISTYGLKKIIDYSASVEIVELIMLQLCWCIVIFGFLVLQAKIGDTNQYLPTP